MTYRAVQQCRYAWQITTPERDEDYRALFTGYESTHALGNLFAMWLKDQGDLPTWDDVDRFAELIARYSDLSAPVVAVWLGLDPDDVPAPPAPEGLPVPGREDLSWQLEGPDGDTIRLERTIED